MTALSAVIQHITKMWAAKAICDKIAADHSRKYAVISFTALSKTDVNFVKISKDVVRKMGYLFLILANIAGISKVAVMKGIGKKCPGKYNSVRINAFRALICALVSVAIFCFSGAKSESGHWWIWLVSGVSNALMMFVWILCTQKIGLVFVETFCMIGAVAIPMLLAPLLYKGERVSLWQWLGAACLLAALIVLSAKPKAAGPVVEKPERKRGGPAFAACIALLILSNVGVSVTQKLYPARVGKEYTPYFNLMTFGVVFLCFAAVLLYGKLVKKKSLLPDSAILGKQLAGFVSIAALMIYVYQYFSTQAAAALPSAVYYPLSRGVGMILTAACDAVIFKQRITKNTMVGVFFIFASILLTNL